MKNYKGKTQRRPDQTRPKTNLSEASAEGFRLNQLYWICQRVIKTNSNFYWFLPALSTAECISNELLRNKEWAVWWIVRFSDKWEAEFPHSLIIILTLGYLFLQALKDIGSSNAGNSTGGSYFSKVGLTCSERSLSVILKLKCFTYNSFK